MFLDHLKWYKINLIVSYKKLSPNMRSHYVVTMNSLLKEIITNELGFDEYDSTKCFFHFDDLKITAKPVVNKKYKLSIISTYDFDTTQKLVEILNKRISKNLKKDNIRIIEVSEISERTLNNLKKEAIFKLDSPYIVLNFYTPLHFSRISDDTRTYIKKEKFFELFYKRIKNIFNTDIDSTNLDEVDIFPFTWKYIQYKHPSKTFVGHTQYINGCVGPIIIKNLSNSLLKDLILICSELHAGGKFSYSYGYYCVENISYLDQFIFENNYGKLREEVIYIVNKIIKSKYTQVISLIHDLNFFLDDALLIGYNYLINLDKEEIIKKFLHKVYDELDFLFYTNKLFKDYISSEEIKSPEILDKLVELAIVIVANNDKFYIAKYKDCFLVLSKDINELENFILSYKLNTNIQEIKNIDELLGTAINLTVHLSDYIPNEKKTIFVDSESSIRYSNNNIVIENETNKIKYPLNHISNIIVSSDVTVTSNLLCNVSNSNIPLIFISRSCKNPIYVSSFDKKFYESVYEHTKKFAELSEEELFQIGKHILKGKLLAYKHNLLIKKHKSFYKSAIYIAEKIHLLERVDEHEKLLGLEGDVAKSVFETYRTVILNPDFAFERRDQIGKDYFNSLLNFLYKLLNNDISTLIRINNLNPYLGFLHKHDQDYETLTYDIQELFRVYIDKLALKIINLNIVRKDDFVENDGQKWLTYDGKKKASLYYETEVKNKRYRNKSIRENVLEQIRYLKEWVQNKNVFRVIYDEQI